MRARAEDETAGTVAAVAAAVDLLDRGRVNELCASLIERARRGADPFPAETAKEVLGILRRKRFFPQMQRVAEAVIQSGTHDARVYRQYAQALIDQGALTAAAAVLRDLTHDPAEWTEARGLLGRVYKQQYVDAVPCGRHGERNGEALRRAIRYYYGPFAESPRDNFWHGINAIACAARARRDGVDDDLIADPEQVAREVRERIQEKGAGALAWELATSIEACVALGDEDAAIARAVRYIRAPGADAFEIASTIRQLEQVWCLDSTHGLGGLVLPLLRGALLERETGGFRVTPAEVREGGAQAMDTGLTAEIVFGADAYTSLQNYVTGLHRTRLVARIGREAGGRGLGTGFLVRGEDLCERFSGDEWLLLTNAHVLSTDPSHGSPESPPLLPDEAVLTFEGLPPGPDGQPQVRGVREELLFLSGPGKLDVAVARLDRPVEGLARTDAPPIARRLPVKDQRGRVYIIGHPAGGSLSFSLHDNLLLDHESPLMHYRTPTEGGSSGSPVYNAQWQLIGIHHAGSRVMRPLRGDGPPYEANEGICIQSIRKALAASPLP